MKAFQWLVLIGMAWMVSAPLYAQSFPDVEVVPDRFHPSDTVIHSNLKMLSQARGVPSMLWMATLTDHKLRSIALSINVRNAEWQFLKCNNVDWLIDGQSPSFPVFTYDGSVSDYGVVETFTAWFTPEQLEQILRAKKIEYRICNSDFEMTMPQHLNLLHFGAELGKQLQPAS